MISPDSPSVPQNPSVKSKSCCAVHANFDMSLCSCDNCNLIDLQEERPAAETLDLASLAVEGSYAGPQMTGLIVWLQSIARMQARHQAAEFPSRL